MGFVSWHLDLRWESYGFLKFYLIQKLDNYFYFGVDCGNNTGHTSLLDTTIFLLSHNKLVVSKYLLS